MATPEQILAVLTGKKVFAGGSWRVYAADGSELADSGGVLWRGVHGALLWAALALTGTPVDQIPIEPPRYYSAALDMVQALRRQQLEEDEVILAVIQQFVLET